jgi:hypothetical protein
MLLFVSAPYGLEFPGGFMIGLRAGGSARAYLVTIDNY